MNNDLQQNTKKVMALVVTVSLLVAAAYFVMYAPDSDTTVLGFNFNYAMAAVFTIYGLFRGYLLFTSNKNID